MRRVDPSVVRAVRLIVDPALQSELNDTVRGLEADGWEVAVIAPGEDPTRPAVTPIGDGVTGVAHRCNDMLSVIVGQAELLLSEISPADPLYLGLDQIRRAGQAASALIRRAQGSGGGRPARPRVVELNHLFTGLEPVLRKLLGDRVELIWVPAAGRPLINVDAVQIEQAILSIAIDACRAIPTGGALRIEARELALASEHNGSVQGGQGAFASLTIFCAGAEGTVDAGPRAFSPDPAGARGDAAIDDELSRVFEILSQNGGSFELESEPGLGSKFTLYFPLAHVSAVDQDEAGSYTNGGGRTILLVDDDDGVRSVVRTMLQRQGFRVLEAANAGEALIVVEQRAAEIDLVLTDVVMPRLSGRKLVDRASAMHGGLKVIYMSGYNDDFVFGHGVLEPGSAFLPKPVRADMLARKLREVLDADGAGPGAGA